MRGLRATRHHLTFGLLAASLAIAMPTKVFAAPFGAGVFGEDVPYGSPTSLGISLSNAVEMTITPSGSSFSGTGSHTVTVTSTDVIGYKLYVNATTDTSLSNGTDTIAASSNNTMNSLAVNSWGYNTTGSTTNFLGMTLSQALLKDASGPYKDGDDTTVTYGAVVDMSKSSGTYTTDITYTAIGES